MAFSIQEQLVNEPMTPTGNYGRPQAPECHCVYKNKHVSIYSIAINCKQWKPISDNQRFAEILIPTLNDEVYDRGMVIVFLDEYNKKVSLPFVYYQLRNPVTINATYTSDNIYINIHGKFVPSVNSCFYFKAIVIDEVVLNSHKDIDWTKYDKILKAFKVKEKTGTH